MLLCRLRWCSIQSDGDDSLICKRYKMRRTGSINHSPNNILSREFDTSDDCTMLCDKRSKYTVSMHKNSCQSSDSSMQGGNEVRMTSMVAERGMQWANISASASLSCCMMA